MSTQMTDEEIRKKATERVQARKGFLIHLAAYLAVNAFLWIIWLVTSGVASGGGFTSIWPVFPTVGWGIAIIIHFFTTFAFHGGWEEREVEKEIARIKKTGGGS